MKKMIFIFLFFITQFTFADMQGTIIFNERNIAKGQTVDVQLLIERSNLSFILQDDDLVLKKISPSLIIIKPNWIKVSENNADIIEASVLVSVLGNIKTWDPISLPLVQEKINFQIKNIPSIGELNSEPINEFQFLPFSLSIPMSPFLKKMIFLGSFLLALTLSYFLFTFLKKRNSLKKQKIERIKQYEEWKIKFEKAKEREEFELLLRDQKKWQQFILDTTIAKGFSDKVQEYQYQKVWDEGVFREIKLHQQRVLNVLKESQNGI
jgi:hypothetical protein